MRGDASAGNPDRLFEVDRVAGFVEWDGEYRGDGRELSIAAAREGGDGLADREAIDTVAERGDGTNDLQPHDERDGRGRNDTTAHQRFREVDSGIAHLHEDFARGRGGIRNVLQDKRFGAADGADDDRFHLGARGFRMNRLLAARGDVYIFVIYVNIDNAAAKACLDGDAPQRRPNGKRHSTANS